MEVEDVAYSGEAFEIWECDHCSFAFTQDAPDQVSIGRYYQYDSYISHSDTQKTVMDRIYHKVRDIMLDKKYKWLNKHMKGKGLLDIGAGTGYFIKYMQDRDYKVTGLEPESTARSVAQEKLNIALRPIEDLASLPDGQYDGISLWHVLEHVHELQSYFDHFNRLLHPDGCLFIAVPNHLSLDSKKYGASWSAWDVPKHLWHFTPQSMKYIAQKNNFEIKAKYQMPYDPYYISMLSEKNKKNKMWQVKGLLTGLRSSLQAKKDVDKSSSILYVMQRT